MSNKNDYFSKVDKKMIFIFSTFTSLNSSIINVIDRQFNSVMNNIIYDDR